MFNSSFVSSYLVAISSRMNNEISIRNCNDSQQVEDVHELELNQSNDGEVQVMGHRGVRVSTSMPKTLVKPDGDSSSILFNEYEQPVDKKPTSQFTHFMRSLARSGKYCPLYKPWPKRVGEKAKANWAKKKMAKVTGAKIVLQCVKKTSNQMSLAAAEDSAVEITDPLGTVNFKTLCPIAEKAKANWEKKKMVRVTPKKRYARVREELKECLMGNELTRKELFRACFSKDTGLQKMAKLQMQLMERDDDV
ncbi:hypothetical protein Tco_1575349 [Tanacetum coccineum]